MNRVTVAIVVVDLEQGRLGLPSYAGTALSGRPALHHTLLRVGQVAAVSRVIVLHPPRQDVAALLQGFDCSKPLHFQADEAVRGDLYTARLVASRKWSRSAWRGGLGGMTCYDELLPAAPMARALRDAGAESALLVGGDWPLVDPALCQRVLELHLQTPEQMQMTFTQAPPGLAGVAIARTLLEQLAEHPEASFGQMLGYNPTVPQADPIGRDVCVQIDSAVRSFTHRMVFDSPRSVRLIERIAGVLGDKLVDADAAAVVAAASKLPEPLSHIVPLPSQVTLELTPRRLVTGPVTPQHDVTFTRDDMDEALALRIVEQLGDASVGDVTLTLGGLGDALLHPSWLRVARAAKHAGVASVHVETDLLCEPDEVIKLLDGCVDVVSVRLNADTAKVYEAAMGADLFAKVIENVLALLNERNRRTVTSGGAGGVPWIVPRLVKTSETLADLETFYDRWIHFSGHAVIDPFTEGCGLSPSRSPVDMAPPRRRACRQIDRRMTIHSDGSVALCDQDWLSRGSVGNARVSSLKELWVAMKPVQTLHALGKWSESPLCGKCKQWHRP
jgi:spiro-SPASM protein